MNDPTDIVSELRAWQKIDADSVVGRAADEIERLRKERDEARREVCIRLGWHFQIVAELEARTDDKHHTWDRFKEAAYRKWDCFKEEP